MLCFLHKLLSLQTTRASLNAVCLGNMRRRRILLEERQRQQQCRRSAHFSTKGNENASYHLGADWNPGAWNRRHLGGPGKPAPPVERPDVHRVLRALPEHTTLVSD